MRKGHAQNVDDDLRWVGGNKPPTRHIALLSERLDHRQDHNSDHENRRHLIDYAIESLRMTVAVSAKVARAAEKKSMQAGEHKDQDDFGLQPA
jgi:hypothetical protein